MSGLLLLLLAQARAADFVPHPRLDFAAPAGSVSAECGKAKDRASSKLAVLAALPEGALSFDGTAGALDAALWDLQDETASAQFLKYVSVSSAVRQAAHECETSIEQFLVETFTREDLYKTLQGYAAKGEKLEGERLKLLEKSLLDFKRNGLALPPAERAEVKRIKLRLAELEAQFGKNLNEVKDSLLFTREELAGLPEDFVGRLERLGEQYRVTLDYPDYFPFMSDASNPKSRQLLENLFSRRAAKENLPILAEVLRLRQKAARLLGYSTHSDYILEERMAKTPAKARDFLGRLRDRLKPLAAKELKTLLGLKKEREGWASDGVIHAWDWRYYDNLLKKTRYQVDLEAMKEYFPADTVTEGMLAVYQKLLGVAFREVKDASLWHPDARLFEVSDPQAACPPAGCRPLGYFYMDLHPREGKYKHAAAFTLVKGRRLPDGSYQAPVSAMVANFTKPTPERPSLLKFGPREEVETFFHEFGHIMHQVLTRARYGRFAGTGVARDFVEAPSQMLENWVWEPEVLDQLSGHYLDRSRKFPRELLAKAVAAKNVNAGLVYLRQVFYASIDLRYHTAPEIADTTAEYGRLMEDVSLIPMSPGTSPEASFGHLMGYDSGYYGYLWSEVFAQDMFSRFQKTGVLDPGLGRLYRETILEPGGGRDEADLLRAFLGRAPNEKAFLRSIGLK